MKPFNNEKHIINITTASESATTNLNSRMLKYAISMTIRIVCILLMLILPTYLGWIALIGAILLPYIAVLLANNALTKKSKDNTHLLTEPPKLEIERQYIQKDNSENTIIQGIIIKKSLPVMKDK